MGRHAPRRGGFAAAVSSLAVMVTVTAASIATTPVTTLPDPQAAAAPPATATTGITATTATTGITATTATTGITATTATTGITATTPHTTATTTLTAPASTTPRTDRPLIEGDTGFLHRQTGRTGLLWTDHATGGTVTVENADGTVYLPGTGCTGVDSACRTAWFGSDSDLVALPTATPTAQITLWDPATSRSEAVTWDSARGTYRALAGRTIVTASSLLDRTGGEWRVRRVTGEATNLGSNGVHAADSAGVLGSDGGRTTLYYIDLATAVSTKVFTGLPATTHPLLSEDRIGWYAPNTAELHLKSRTDPTAAERVVRLPANPGELDGDPVLVGDWLLLPLTSPALGSRLLAVDVNDPSVQRTLLTSAGNHTLAAGGGGALVTGGTGAADWWVWRVTEDADGTPLMRKVWQIPATENTKRGIALSRGSLRVAEHDPTAGAITTSLRSLTTDNATTLTASEPVPDARVSAARCAYPGTLCNTLWGNLDAEDVHLDGGGGNPESGSTEDRLVRLGTGGALEFGGRGGRIVDVSDDYAVYDSGGTAPSQYVGEFGQGQLLKRSVRAAALNGPTLWSATTTPGKLTSYDLPGQRTLSTVTVPGLACVPSELQAAGRWVYWACGTASAGVYDSKAGTARAVAPGDVLLGDGFTVRHDHGANTLVLTEATTGTTRTLATGLPTTGTGTGTDAPMDRRFRWTVDEYTGLVAWFDDYDRTRVATTGIAPSPVTAFDSSAGDRVAPGTPFQGRWVLSRPVTSWSLTLTSLQSGANGRATRTLTGTGTPARAAVTWNGTTANGAHFPTGGFSWTLRATGIGTATPITVTSGKGTLARGAAVRRDFGGPDGPDGRGDLLTLTSSGGLTLHTSTGTGKLGTKLTGTGWPTTITAVPFGDLSGDRCNDVLVRYSSGALRLYKPGCGAAPKPSTPYTTLGTSGWTQYNALTSPGDVSGDGRPDLIVRSASTGAVYLYKGTSTGKLSARIKLYDNWKNYKKIIGTGDLTGDGRPDLLAQDSSNTVYRYNGKGDGTFAPRTKVLTNWGGSYNAVIGVGDITDDGRPDLISRDTGGTLWRNNGDGKGSFGARTKIASGWSTYRALG